VCLEGMGLIPLDGKGVCRSILLEPSGMGSGLGYYVYECRSDLIDLI
jgi:hypothetical protein